jgi:hypothetical protein
MQHAESSVESVTADVADLKVSKPSPPPNNPAPDTSTSAAAAPAHKHDDMEQEEETETAEDRAKREAELSKIYADLAKEDDRCVRISTLAPAPAHFSPITHQWHMLSTC